jgi:alpha-mannosidase
MKRGNSTLTSLDTLTPQLKVLVGGQVDGSKLGIHNQGGDGYFLQRFALRTHGAFDQAAAMRFGLEHQCPLVTGPVTGNTAAFDEKSFGLLSVNDSKVLLWALKPAEDGILQAGIALRVWNMSDTESNFTAQVPGWRIVSAKNATHIETPTGDAQVSSGALTTKVSGHAMETYLLKPGAENRHAPPY